jgi:hypothetical protein
MFYLVFLRKENTVNYFKSQLFFDLLNNSFCEKQDISMDKKFMENFMPMNEKVVDIHH